MSLQTEDNKNTKQEHSENQKEKKEKLDNISPKKKNVEFELNSIIKNQDNLTETAIVDKNSDFISVLKNKTFEGFNNSRAFLKGIILKKEQVNITDNKASSILDYYKQVDPTKIENYELGYFRVRIPEIHNFYPNPLDIEDEEKKNIYMDLHPVFTTSFLVPTELTEPIFSEGELVWVDFTDRENFTGGIIIESFISKSLIGVAQTKKNLGVRGKLKSLEEMKYMTDQELKDYYLASNGIKQWVANHSERKFKEQTVFTQGIKLNMKSGLVSILDFIQEERLYKKKMVVVADGYLIPEAAKSIQSIYTRLGKEIPVIDVYRHTMRSYLMQQNGSGSGTAKLGGSAHSWGVGIDFYIQPLLNILQSKGIITASQREDVIEGAEKIEAQNRMNLPNWKTITTVAVLRMRLFLMEYGWSYYIPNTIDVNENEQWHFNFLGTDTYMTHSGEESITAIYKYYSSYLMPTRDIMNFYLAILNVTYKLGKDNDPEGVAKWIGTKYLNSTSYYSQYKEQVEYIKDINIVKTQEEINKMKRGSGRFILTVLSSLPNDTLIKSLRKYKKAQGKHYLIENKAHAEGIKFANTLYERIGISLKADIYVQNEKALKVAKIRSKMKEEKRKQELAEKQKNKKIKKQKKDNSKKNTEKPKVKNK